MIDCRYPAVVDRGFTTQQKVRDRTWFSDDSFNV